MISNSSGLPSRSTCRVACMPSCRVLGPGVAWLQTVRVVGRLQLVFTSPQYYKQAGRHMHGECQTTAENLGTKGKCTTVDVEITLTRQVLPVALRVMREVKKMRSRCLKCTVASLAILTPSNSINTSPFCSTCNRHQNRKGRANDCKQTGVPVFTFMLDHAMHEHLAEVEYGCRYQVAQ